MPQILVGTQPLDLPGSYAYEDSGLQMKREAQDSSIVWKQKPVVKSKLDDCVA